MSDATKAMIGFYATPGEMTDADWDMDADYEEVRACDQPCPNCGHSEWKNVCETCGHTFGTLPQRVLATLRDTAAE